MQPVPNQLSDFTDPNEVARCNENFRTLENNDSRLTKDLPPIGFIMLYAKATAPDYYILCNGANISRNTYSLLFAVIGTTFGVGDGSTTFGLPNLAAPVANTNYYIRFR